MNGVIKTDLLLYDPDGKPIVCSTDAALTITPVPEDWEEIRKSILGQEYTGTVTFKPFQLSDEYYKNYIRSQILSLPRKKKKRIKRLLEKGYTMNVTFR